MARRRKPPAKPSAAARAPRGKGSGAAAPVPAAIGLDDGTGDAAAAAAAAAALTQAGTDTPGSGAQTEAIETPDIDAGGTDGGLIDSLEDAPADTGRTDFDQVTPATPAEPIEDTPETPAAAAAMRAPVPRRPRPTGPAPDPFAVLVDYERRSLAHAPGLPEQLEAPGLWRGVGFRLGHKRLASGFDEVVEILPLPPVTPVPGAQPWMLGVANIRGNLLPIVDLKQFLEGERTVLHEGQRVLIVRQPGGDVAITIDELFGQRSFTDEQSIEPEGLAEGRYTHFVDRAYRLGDQSWGIFSLERLARTPEFRQAAA